MDSGNALAVEVVHQPAQDALVEDRVGLLEEAQDHDPFGFPLAALRGPVAGPGGGPPGVPFLDEAAEAVGGELDELLFLEEERIFAAARGLLQVADLDGADGIAPGQERNPLDPGRLGEIGGLEDGAPESDPDPAEVRDTASRRG